jgi:hypothetical protein
MRSLRMNKTTNKRSARLFCYGLTALLTSALPAQAEDIHDPSATAFSDSSYPQFHLMGFGDISYLSSDSDQGDGFAIGQAVAHFAAALDESLSVFGEFSLTAHDSEYTIEAERLIVRYEFSDLFKLSAGRYHTPIGYWNTSFHHGAWLQTTVSRPEMVKFGSKIVPIHFVGGLIEGSLPNNALGLSYLAGFGNGRHANIARAGDAGDINGDNAWMVQVNFGPARYYGFHTGFGLYTDTVNPDGQPAVDESIASAYVAWAKESPEVLVEFLREKHELAADSSVNGDTTAWYAQFAYRLGGAYRDWKPYLRIERTDVDDSDPLLGELGLDYRGGILGVRWDFNQYAALKAEYRNEEFNHMGRENNFRLQVAVVLTQL